MFLRIRSLRRASFAGTVAAIFLVSVAVASPVEKSAHAVAKSSRHNVAAGKLDHKQNRASAVEVRSSVLQREPANAAEKFAAEGRFTGRNARFPQAPPLKLPIDMLHPIR